MLPIRWDILLTVKMLTPIIGGIAAFIISMFVLANGRNREGSRLYFLGSVSLAIWFFAGVYREYNIALGIIPDLSARILVFMTTWATGLTVHFSLRFIRYSRVPKWVLILLYGIIIFISISAFSKYSVKNSYIKDGFYIREFGPLYYLYAVYLLITILTFFIIILYKIKTSKEYLRKKQGIYILLALMSPVVGGIFAVLLPIFIDYQFIFLAQLSFLGFLGFSSYAIIRYKAMDIHQILSKSVLWIFSFLILGIPLFLMAEFIQNNEQNLNTLNIFLIISVMFGIMMAYLKHVQPIIDEKLQKKVYDYRRIVENFSRRITSLKNLTDLSHTIYEILIHSLNASSVNILIRGKNKDIFYYFSPIPQKKRILLKDKYKKILLAFNEVLEKEQVLLNPDYKSIRRYGKIYFNLFPVEVVIPVSYENNLIALIHIGSKMEGYYSRIEIDYLTEMMANINIAFSNSLLLKRVEELNRTLEIKVKQRTRELNEAYQKLNYTYDEMKKDLNLAKMIQDRTLPKNIASIRQKKFYIIYRPLIEIGGDYYDIFERENGIIRIFLADATGHGIGAALITMLIRSEYEKWKSTHDRPESILKELNESFISRYSELNMFFTGIILDLDVDHHSLTYSSAGHPDQFLLRENSVEVIERTDRAVGLKGSHSFSSRKKKYDFNDRILLFTDGIFEEFNLHKEEYGETRLRNKVAEKINYSLKEIISDIDLDIKNFLGNSEVNDDITVIGIE